MTVNTALARSFSFSVFQRIRNAFLQKVSSLVESGVLTPSHSPDDRLPGYLEKENFQVPRPQREGHIGAPVFAQQTIKRILDAGCAMTCRDVIAQETARQEESISEGLKAIYGDALLRSKNKGESF